jgi:serine O-acetyltransferase
MRELISSIREDITTAMRRDPAARTPLEVVLTYPGIHAIWAHRIAHRWWRRGWKLAARVLAASARRRTGIEIHPGAVIGRRVFIDHGMAVVIGETTRIGNDVLIYHDVTLGARPGSSGKRHPTIGDHVILGAGARVIGSVTIANGALIAANEVVTTDRG